jgi:hypothetical protein
VEKECRENLCSEGGDRKKERGKIGVLKIGVGKICVARVWIGKRSEGKLV